MANAGIKREDNNNDVSSTFDFNASDTGQFIHTGPYKITMYGWCTVANAGAGVIIQHRHRDPSYPINGNVDVDSAVLSLNIDMSNVGLLSQTSPEIIERLSGSSLWQLIRSGSNSGGTGEYSLRVVVEPLFDYFLGDFDIIT